MTVGTALPGVVTRVRSDPSASARRQAVWSARGSVCFFVVFGLYACLGWLACGTEALCRPAQLVHVDLLEPPGPLLLARSGRHRVAAATSTSRLPRPPSHRNASTTCWSSWSPPSGASTTWWPWSASSGASCTTCPRTSHTCGSTWSSRKAVRAATRWPGSRPQRGVRARHRAPALPHRAGHPVKARANHYAHELRAWAEGERRRLGTAYGRRHRGGAGHGRGPRALHHRKGPLETACAT